MGDERASDGQKIWGPTAIQACLATIRSTDLKAVAEHWAAAKGERLMPCWRQLQPSRMAKQLPIIWAFKYDPETRQFLGRLAGTRVTQLMDRSFRGQGL